MKMIDREKVDGTEVTIGRRLFTRLVEGKPFESAVTTFSAVYKDADGKWRSDALGVSTNRQARRMAIEIQMRLDTGKAKPKPVPKVRPARLSRVAKRYHAFCKSKGLAPTSLAKYHADLIKLRTFAVHKRIQYLEEFDEEKFYAFRGWLADTKHKQGVKYADKSIYAALILTKQLFKWARRMKLIRENPLEGISLPVAKAKPQPCFTTEQVEQVLAVSAEPEYTMFATLAYSGMRVGELEQLDASAVMLGKNTLGMFHIREGGSLDTTKDKDARFVPIHPRILPLIEALPQRQGLVFPEADERRLLRILKQNCEKCGLGRRFKLHSFRHHFASLCANHQVAYKKALSWLGHSSSDILDLYYHLEDEESAAAMQALAAHTRGSR